MDGVILIAIMIPSIVALFTFLVNLNEDNGTKGIEKKPYYGRKTGTVYTAKKDREKHLV